MEFHKIANIHNYEPLIGSEAVDRILSKAHRLNDLHIVHINSTFYGGGVSEILSSLTLLMNSLGIKTGWRVISGSPDFFAITKKMHNALQGSDYHFTRRKVQVFEEVIHENAIRMHLNHDMVVVHDPQPLPIVAHNRKRGPWIWRCHLQLHDPHPQLWEYLQDYIQMYDAVIMSLPEYRQKLNTPQVFFMPAIDPFSQKNRELSDPEIDERLSHYNIPVDLPILVQISRFDRWKDPEGVIQAFRIARKEVPCTLVLLGSMATDDPEGAQIYESLLKCQEERLLILSSQDSALVNALQRRAAVVLQKSLREGFGLTVAEAMLKGTPVIGGRVGGIPHQIDDNINGFLVSSPEEAAARIVQLLKDDRLREEMGRRARDSVLKNFLLSRLVEQYLDLFSSFRSNFSLIS
ncbi:glycosyltransferase [Geotalea toluenoxydans]